MGYWTLETSKQDAEGNDIELNMNDLEHIAEAIEQGYTSGEVLDKEVKGNEGIKSQTVSRRSLRQGLSVSH